MKGVRRHVSDDAGDGAPSGQIGRAIAVLEAIAENGSSTARTIAEVTSIPLPTIYRIAHELMRAGYLVHLKDEQRFALGYQLHRLAVGLHNDLGVPRSVREEVRSLHEDLRVAAYLAIHRGTDFVVVFVADSPLSPRLSPMGFGFHDNPHATAFGKVGLSSLDATERETHLTGSDLTRLTPHTLIDPGQLSGQLTEIAKTGAAWEHQEFQEGTECLAVPMKAANGALIGSIAISAPVGVLEGRHRHVEDRVRACASRAGRKYRLGTRAG